jgi:hypothetical protein
LGGVFAGDPSAIDTYEHLAQIGALTRRDAPITYEEVDVGLGVGLTKRPRHFAYFTPTAEAKPLFSELETSTGSEGAMKTVPALCYGIGRVDRIDNFTIPGDASVKTTTVTYTWSTEPLGTLAQRIHDSQIPLVQTPPLSGTKTIVLSLTNKGWEPLNSIY